MDTYRETEDYKIEIEQEQDVFFLHCDVSNFSPGVMKEIKIDFLNILEVFLTLGVDSIYAYTTNVKFCKSLLPCKVIGEIELSDEAHSIVEWDIMEGLSWGQR